MAKNQIHEKDDLNERVTALEEKLAALEAKMPVAPAPATTGGLYALERPAVRDITPWADKPMTQADTAEVIERALHGVGWRGNYIADSAYDEAWAEIEKLKAGDAKLISRYAMLDPEFAGVGLLTGLFHPVKYDAITFGQNAKDRESFAGQTVASFILTQLSVSGAPSGGA